LENPDGSLRALVGVIADITDRKEHENEELKMQKLESLGILAGGIAHDFNNILTGIVGNISLAKVFLDDTHKSFNALVGAEKASVRATELARQLLTFARGGEPVKTVISLQHLVNESLSLVLHGSNVKGTVDIPDSIHAIEADEGQISQVFQNIIINATQAMPGGGALTVSARNEMLGDNNNLALPPGTYTCLTFTDEGCGISDADLNKIFDPYFTTKVTGTGLGLASTRSIIIKHGGHISVSSKIDKGTTFSIYLPSIGETYSVYQAESDSRNFRAHNSGSILVMDDEEMIRELAAAMLEEIGYHVTTCADGSEAIRYYKAAMESGAPFSAVIMDLTIPGGMGGKEAAKGILALDPLASLIVSSGYSNDPIMSDFSTYGFTGAIAKPYTISDLAQILH
jgi:nitrogen-specific signal transduction histidine kinase/CheY-like chemotaxis protein